MSGALHEIPAVPVLLPLVVVGGSLTTVALHRRGAPAARIVLAWAAWLYGAAVLAVTLLPLQVATGAYANLAPWTSKLQPIPLLTIDVRTFVLNVVMTLPLGVLVPLLSARLRTVGRVALLALGVSAGIEVVQFATNVLVSSGRIADVNDLVANTLGAVLGLLALRTVTHRPENATRRRPAVRPDDAAVGTSG